VLIKSSRAHSARHEFISHSYSLPCHHHRQEETRTLIRDSLSLSLCVHSLSLCVLVLLLFVFTFHPQKWALDTKIKTLFPPLSLSFLDESIRSSSAQIPTCYNCVIKGLHEYFIRVETCFFVIIAARCLFFVHTRERERERKRKKEKSAQKRRRRKFCIYKIRETWKRGKKTSRCDCFSAATRERERERDRLRNTLHNHAVFCHTSTFTSFAFLLIIIAY